ncbi:MAG: hypothetical protein ACRC28_02965 [Clostridium sp.]|uniref:hypothetical protein n=1 Tax=Clostridium sp. TaxID=1506 RepID=UPI003F301DB3
MVSIFLILLDIIVVIMMITTFIKAFSTFKHVGKIDNYESEVSDEMQEVNKKGTKYMLFSVMLVPVSILLTIFIVLSNAMH